MFSIGKLYEVKMLKEVLEKRVEEIKLIINRDKKLEAYKNLEREIINSATGHLRTEQIDYLEYSIPKI